MELIVDIKKRFENFKLEASFKAKDETIGFLGGSGSGKSMTLRCIAGLEKPDEGTIVLDGRVLFDSSKKIDIPSQRRKVGLLFQNYALFPHLTVKENIAFGLFQLNKSNRVVKVKEQLKRMHLEGFEDRYPFQLSGGQQQRVAIARALVIEPEALLLDEPFSALDNHLRSQMEKQLIEILQDYRGITAFVSHDINESYRVCNKILIYHNGQVIADGIKDAIFSNPNSVEVAKITGCKNILLAQKLSSTRVLLPRLGIEVETNPLDEAKVEYLGIRAHYIKLATVGDEKNVFPAKIVSTLETPFRMTVYLKLNTIDCIEDDELLQWDISKEKWSEVLQVGDSLRIQLPMDKLFCMAN